MNISAIALGGLQQAQAEVERVAKQVSLPGTSQAPVAKQASGTSNIQTPADAIALSNEAVALMVAQSQYEANLSALEAAYQMEKTVLEATGTP